MSTSFISPNAGGTARLCRFRIVLRPALLAGTLLLSWPSALVHANPQGGTVAQGTASFATFGAQLTVTTSDHAFINWQSFNIGAGETTTFVQPSASSLVWNRINDPNPSQILGNLNANGYVVLQNAAGFYIGGQAAISTHGLLMTTAPLHAPDVFSGGAWQFDTPPPTAQIVNYGQINVAGGAPAFLIASDIQNHGTIAAPGGKIGLYAGQTVLVSTSPDGRGISAEVTLPAGSVDNEGRLIADGGSIALQAKVVNQNNLIQANSVRDVNGTIELVAGDSVNLGAGSLISAHGDTAGASAGGSVTVKAGQTFADQAGSTIDIRGGTEGGQGGQVELSAAQMGPIASSISGGAQAGFTGGTLSIDPYDITLDAAYVNSLNSQISGGLSQISLQADHDILLTTAWSLADQTADAQLSLSAGHNITFNNGTSLRAGNHWNLDLTAGTALPAGTTPGAGDYGIYLNGNAYLQGFNGDINLWAANEVQVGWSGTRLGAGTANAGTGRIVTLGGGSIAVTTLFGDVNTGSSTSGFNYLKNAPFYTPFSVNPFSGAIGTTSTLGGISTAAGGDVTITAGGDVTSYLPVGNAGNPTAAPAGDPGTGAFGSQPGNVTINAGGSVYGHYMVVNGTGSINAQANVGSATHNVALSLANGSWDVNAGWNAAAQTVTEGAGDIYLQEVRNPNGVFNVQGGASSAGYHWFDYAPDAAVDLTAGSGVYLTGQNLPRPNGAVPVLLPPSLSISAGAGGINLLGNMTLFPSPDADLTLVTRPGTGGDFIGFNSSGLIMSDSGETHWYVSNTGLQPFSPADHASTPVALENTDPATVSIDGDMKNVILQTSKAAEISVGGDLINSQFSGQNLHADDVTSIDVHGQIYSPGSFNSVILPSAPPIAPLDNLPPNTINNWQTLLALAVDPVKVAALGIPSGTDPSAYASYISQVLQFGNSLQNSFAYNGTTKKLTFIGPMSSGVLAALSQPLTVLRYDALGNPVVERLSDGKLHFVTDQITWAPASAINSLFLASQGAPSLDNAGGGLVVGGTGTFNVHAGSISLGNSYGILSLGSGKLLGRDYSTLAPYIQSGAALNVTVDGDLNMPSSTIASLCGGDVTVNSLGGAMDLGSQDLVDFEGQIMRRNNLGLGIYTSGGGDVTVLALGDINVDSSRIATFNGGDIHVRSETGDVNAGSGGRIQIPINVFSPFVHIPTEPFEYVYANGIVAETLVNAAQVPGSSGVPGNILVEAPQGDILAGLGGILQQALNGNLSSGPTITLVAGSDDYVGNIDLGNSGVIGVTVNLKASGDIRGLVISRENSSVDAGQNFSGTVLSGGTANLAAGGSVSGTIIGVGGVNASGVGGVSAALLGQNVSVNGGTAQSTLGTTASATGTSQAAAQQSSDNGQQVASNTAGDDDDEKKKKKGPAQLLRRVKRVTIILPKA